MQKMQQDVYHLIYDDGSTSIASKVFDICVISLIILNTLLAVLDTFQMPPWYTPASNAIELVSVLVFTFEYLLRLWVAPQLYPHLNPHAARVRYVVSFMAIIDLLAVLPFYISFLPGGLRALRIVRMLRIFKVNRYTDALSTIGDVFRKRASQLVSSMLVVFMLLIIASVLMWNVEHKAQPGVFDNALDSFWWALGTITSSGYGDVYPVTMLGKFLSAIISLLGIGIVAVPTGIISAGFVDAMGEINQEEVDHDAEKIRTYKKLMEEGAITPDEYDEKKKKILDLD